MQQVRGVVSKTLADGTVQLRLGDRRGKWTKIRCRTLDDLWSSKEDAPVTPDVHVPTGTPPALIRWRAKVLTHLREVIRKVEQNAEEWGYPLDDFPIHEELLEMQTRLRDDPTLPTHEAHRTLRKAKAYMFMAEWSDDE